MDSLNAFERRLTRRDPMVEKEIASYNQQLEALNKRVEGLKRAAELFELDEAAISELLQAGTANGGVTSRTISSLSVAKVQTAPAGPKSTNAQQRRAPKAQSRGNSLTRPATQIASRNDGLTRLEMIAAVLNRHPRRTVRELIALLDRE